MVPLDDDRPGFGSRVRWLVLAWIVVAPGMLPACGSGGGTESSGDTSPAEDTRVETTEAELPFSGLWYRTRPNPAGKNVGFCLTRREVFAVVARPGDTPSVSNWSHRYETLEGRALWTNLRWQSRRRARMPREDRLEVLNENVDTVAARIGASMVLKRVSVGEWKDTFPVVAECAELPAP